VPPVCGGIDVHHARLMTCLRCVQPEGQVMQDVRECATTYSALVALTEWLVEQHCPVVAMESTRVYWQPVYHVLSWTLEVAVGNAQEMRRRPGRKTDTADAQWIAELLAHGLIWPSLLPPPIQAFVILTRTRVARSQAKNRVHDILEDTNIQLASVIPDLFGVSGRRMLPKAVKECSLRSVQLTLVKAGARLGRHARRLVFRMAEVAVPRDVWMAILARIGGLRLVPG
jgi:transposase